MSTFSFNIFSDRVQRQVRRRTLEKHETLFWEGADADTIYYIEEGCVRLVVCPQDDKQMVIYRARDGEPFAEEHLSLDKYIYRAIADKPSVIQFVAKQLVLDDINSNSQVARRFIDCLCGRYYRLRTNFERLGITPAKNRVLHLLSTLCDEQGYCGDLSGRIKSLSDDLNLTHEAMYRALRELEKDQSIRREDGLIQVLKFPELM